jgi:hypothetical protein
MERLSRFMMNSRSRMCPAFLPAVLRLSVNVGASLKDKAITDKKIVCY